MTTKWLMIPALMLGLHTTATAGDLRIDWLGGSVIVRGCYLGALDLAPLNIQLPQDQPPLEEPPAPQPPQVAPQPPQVLPEEPAPAPPQIAPRVPVQPPVVNPGRNLNMIRNAGNGVGNTIIIDGNGVGGGTTIVENVRNGYGNKLIVGNPGSTVIIGTKSYPREQFQSAHKQYHYGMRCWLYWSNRDMSWYKYDGVNDRYQQVPLDALFDE